VAAIVAFHAHPDDEVLLTGGTIARLAAEGHRVIIVVACDGDMWDGPDQGRRLEELRTSAAILGADKAVHLGYADSGHGPVLFEDPPGQSRFARADVPGRRPLSRGTKAGGAGGAPDAGFRPGARGQAAPRADQVAPAGIPRCLRDRMVRRTRGTDGRTRRLRSDGRPWPTGCTQIQRAEVIRR
jgi:LmbE family N-acetylglucosaminyl deacetylase